MKVPAIRTEGLSKRYGPLDALRDLNLEVAEGEVVGFLGPNGAGKSTTIRLLLGLVRPPVGRAEIFGLDCRRRTVQSVFLSSHILSEVEALCDRVAILREGRLVEVGTLSQLRHLSTLAVEVLFTAAPPDLTGVQGVTHAELELLPDGEEQ